MHAAAVNECPAPTTFTLPEREAASPMIVAISSVERGRLIASGRHAWLPAQLVNRENRRRTARVSRIGRAGDPPGRCMARRCWGFGQSRRPRAPTHDQRRGGDQSEGADHDQGDGDRGDRSGADPDLDVGGDVGGTVGVHHDDRPASGPGLPGQLLLAFTGGGRGPEVLVGGSCDRIDFDGGVRAAHRAERMLDVVGESILEVDDLREPSVREVALDVVGPGDADEHVVGRPGAVDGTWGDAELAAWLMAVAVRGLDVDEAGELTRAMFESGESWDLASDVPTLGDKHSTGGVGDKTYR